MFCHLHGCYWSVENGVCYLSSDWLSYSLLSVYRQRFSVIFFSMAPSKFQTKKGFGLKKRYCKPRGRSGGRRISSNSSEGALASSSESTIARPNDHQHAMGVVTFSSVEATLLSESATKRKLFLFSSHGSDLYGENTVANTPSDTGQAMYMPSVNVGFHDPVGGYRLVSIDCIVNLINSLACSQCGQSDFRIQEKRWGLKSVFSVNCDSCEKNVNVTSTRTGASDDVNEANLLAIAASRNSGMGYQAMCNLMGNLDIPKPMHLKTYQEAANKVHVAAMAAAEQNLTDVALIVHQAYSGEQIDAVNKGSITDIAVSFDGTWHKRGHSSLFGVGVAIDLLTGFVVDFACLSKYCHGCEIGPRPNDAKYEEWRSSHAEACQINFSGSSNAMEAEAAIKIFHRSLPKYSLRYTTMLCDGDSKAFQRVLEENVYGSNFPVTKQDCINHVAKRMGTALRKLRQDDKLGGKGKLTNEAVVRLQNYYGKALKDHAPDVNDMKRAVYASLFHVISTDEEPHHRFCPPGSMSWCHYQRALLDENKKKHHKPLFSKEIGEKLLPVYSRLTDTQLLQRCASNKTQNANESFNALIWRRCPKTEFTSLKTLETAVALAVLEHNKGAEGYFSLLSNLGINVGQCHSHHAHLKNKMRINDSERTFLENRKKIQKGRKLQKAKETDKLEKQEGVTYQSGAF